MKWELLTLGISWGYFIFKLYQQYRRSKNLYQNQSIIQEEPIQQQQKVLYDSQNKIQVMNAPVSGQNVPNSANEIKKLEGKCSKENENSSKSETSLETTQVDECDFVVFPELYPHLRKRKHLSKEHLHSKEKARMSLRRKRDTKKYFFTNQRFKEWFQNNKVLLQIQDYSQINPQKMEQITKEIKATSVEGRKPISDSNKSDEGTEMGNAEIIIKRGFNEKEDDNNRILGFLQEDQNFEASYCKIEKYDPFF